MRGLLGAESTFMCNVQRARGPDGCLRPSPATQQSAVAAGNLNPVEGGKKVVRRQGNALDGMECLHDGMHMLITLDPTATKRSSPLSLPAWGTPRQE